MRKIIPIVLCLLYGGSALTQQVGIGTNNPNASALLELKANNKGLLLPRTSTSSRTAITNPVKGLMLYDTTAGSIYIHNGNAWVQLGAGGGTSGWGLTGNAGTNSNTSFLGTTDARTFRIRVNGEQSGFIDYTSPYMTAFGYQVLKANFGQANTGVGYQALYSDTSGGYNTAQGFQALYYTSLGSFNTAFGASSMFYNKTGNYNTASGYNSLANNIDGYSNTGSGYYALFANTYGHGNSGFGTNAVNSNTTGIYNSGFGYAALYSTSTGDYNTAGGAAALYDNNASYNSAFGFEAMRQNRESYNTAVGYQALRNTVYSQYNTAIGYHAGYNLDNGYNNVFLGANTDVNGIGYYNVIAIGQQTICTASSQVTMGNLATNSYRAYANWSNISDGRYKKNMKEDVPGLAFILQLKPVTYSLDVNGIDRFLHKNDASMNKENLPVNAWMAKAMAEKALVRHTGFVAQDVERTARSLGFDFSGIDAPKNNNDFYGLRYAEFVVPLVKAVQEQQKIIEEERNEIAVLKAQVDALTKTVNGLINK